MNRYQKKQFTIAIIFIFIVVVIGGGIYFLFRSPTPNCFDGIQNQGEKGVDCGGPCGLCQEPEDLIILLENFILTTGNNYDLVAKVKNPNRDWGVELLKYRFNLYSKDNELIGDKEGETYILPQETKYIIEQRVLVEDIENIELELKEINWRKLRDFKELEIRIRDKKYEIIDERFTRVSGVVENKSSYNLDKIEVIGLLFSNEKITAAGKTDVRTVLMGETRYFEINWPYQITEPISSFELKPQTNVFLNENFLKTHATPERFKEY